jgi:AraC family ethanolamine operon transcriptional activator
MWRMMGEHAAGGARRFADPDAFAGALLGGEFEYLPMPGQPFDATLRVLRLGDVVVQQAHDSAHVTRAAMQPGLVGLVLPLGHAARLPSANGLALGAREGLLLPGGVEFTVACLEPQEWGALSLPMGMMEELAELGAPTFRADAPCRLELDGATFAALSGAVAAAGQMAEGASDLPATAADAASLAASLREMLATALAPGLPAIPPGRAAKEAMRVHRDAEAYLHAQLDRPIYRDDLCAALGVSRRKLHDAFIAVVGMTPPAYLKLRRLVLARRALRAGDGSRLLVKSVALSHGFWHLGYFARDYRALFGELPSQTAAAAR